MELAELLLGYKVIALPLADGVLVRWGLCPTAVGAVLMSVSTIIVAINTQLRRHVRLRRQFLGQQLISQFVLWAAMRKARGSHACFFEGFRFVEGNSTGLPCGLWL
jgi:hypothetical protein